MKKYILFMIIMQGIISCTGTQNKTENSSEEKVTELESEETKIVNDFNYRYNQKDYIAAIDAYSKLKNKYPSSNYLDSLDKKVSNARQIVEKERIEEKKSNKITDTKGVSFKNLKSKYDDIENVTWYQTRLFNHVANTNKVSIYMGIHGKQGKSPWLRLMLSYTGDDWIFFKNALLSYDGNTKTIPFNDYKDKKSDNSGGEVWEWIDVPIEDQDVSWFNQFADSPNAKMRLSGKYEKTRNLTKNERQAIKDVLAAYYQLKNN